MSTFWSRWVAILVVINLGVTLWLFIWGQRLKIPTQPDGTTGHIWAHGVLRESVRKLPLWWVLMSIATFLAAIALFVLYPGFGNFKGTLEWTSVQELQRDTADNNAKLDTLTQPFRTLTIEQLAADPKTAAAGRPLYLDNCASCHGYEALGNQTIGAPNLIDGDTLYGESSEILLTSIRDGRSGAMPALGTILGQQGLNETTAYVLSLGGTKTPADWTAAGKVRFETLCVACHGADGRGNLTLGIPNLTDKTWLYGGDIDSVYASIRDGRNGVMPSWRLRLSEDQMRMIATWVYAQRHRELATTR